MVISKIEEGKGNKYRIYADSEYLFSLYQSEIKRFSIKEGADLSMERYQSILEEIVFKRAKERALYLLERRPYTTYKLTLKLKENEYPPIVIDQVIEFLERYHYIDDLEYARMYANTYCSKKSKRAIAFDLQKKGIGKEISNQILCELDCTEEDAIRNQMDKYLRGKDVNDSKMKEKTIRYFLGKGFSYGIIRSVLSQKMGIEDCF